MSLIITVAISVFVVTLMVQAVTYVDTDSVGVATATPGAAFGVKGAGIFDGFVSADYFTSTSTANSWLLGGGFGLGTTTPGTKLAVRGAGLFDGFVSADYFTSTSTANSWLLGQLGIGTTTPSPTLNDDGGFAVEGSAIIGDTLTVSALKSTSTVDAIFGGALDVRESATSTFVGGINVTTTGGLSSASGLTISGGDIQSSGKLTITSAATSSVTGGLTVDTDTLNVDSSSNRVGIATSSFPSIGDQIVNVSIGVGTASTTVYIAGAGSVGSGIILKDSDGNGCTILMVNDGLLEATDVVCPAP